LLKEVLAVLYERVGNGRSLHHLGRCWFDDDKSVLEQYQAA
jgi:hypothetical protein